MKVAWDLFSGTGSATKYFRNSSDWRVYEVDAVREGRIQPDVKMDVSSLEPDTMPEPDFVWASPPCTCFSMASVRWYWNKTDDGYKPTDDDPEKRMKAVRHMSLVMDTIDLIEAADPKYWFMENPRALLRSILEEQRGITPEGTVTYCQFGDNRMKPTDLWGRHPDGFEYRSCSNGDSCHESAPRGSNHSGTQNSSMDAVERAMIPDGLAKHVFETVSP